MLRKFRCFQIFFKLEVQGRRWGGASKPAGCVCSTVLYRSPKTTILYYCIWRCLFLRVFFCTILNAAAFLPCDHGLDFLHQLMCNSINQSKTAVKPIGVYIYFTGSTQQYYPSRGSRYCLYTVCGITVLQTEGLFGCIYCICGTNGTRSAF